VRAEAALAVAVAAALGCAHGSTAGAASTPGSASAAPEAAPPPAPPPLRLQAGAPAMLDVDATFQAPQLADARCLEPDLARAARPPGPGAVVVRFGVAADGSVEDLAVVANTAGGGAETLAALGDAIKACRWIPARSPQGRRVRVLVEERFEFEVK
jgi:hypothetical protein